MISKNDFDNLITYLTKLHLTRLVFRENNIRLFNIDVW